MMPETKLIVVRHGETEWNIQKRWQGHDNSPLTTNGEKQGKAVAKALKLYDTKALYSSDLGRANQTAHYIAEATGHVTQNDARLRERHLGIFQGFTSQQMESQFPQEYFYFKNDGVNYQVPEGESIQQQFDRSVECFNDLANKHAGESIIVVTHGGVLDGLFRYVTGLALSAPRRFKIWNCSLNTFLYVNGDWELHSFGDISHLRMMQTLDDE